MMKFVEKSRAFLDGRRCCVAAAMRMVLGWHLAYLGVWALTSTWTYSWSGSFRCARWLFGDVLRAVGHSSFSGAIDVTIAWALLASGILLMLGKAVRSAAAFGIFYFVLMYLVNPPHFGHTGESHFLYIDRNAIEILMLFTVMTWKKEESEAAE